MHSVTELETAFRRAIARMNSRQSAEAFQAARNTLRRKGWSQVAAAKALGVSSVHLCYVLNGRRQSRRLLHGIARLPENPNPA